MGDYGKATNRIPNLPSLWSCYNLLGAKGTSSLKKALPYLTELSLVGYKTGFGLVLQASKSMLERIDD